VKAIFAIYGPSLATDRWADTFHRTWEWSEDLAANCGLELTDFNAKCRTPAPRLKDSKAYRIRRSAKRLIEQLELDNVAKVKFTSLQTKPSGYIAFDWDCDVNCKAVRARPTGRCRCRCRNNGSRSRTFCIAVLAGTVNMDPRRLRLRCAHATRSISRRLRNGPGL